MRNFRILYCLVTFYSVDFNSFFLMHIILISSKHILQFVLYVNIKIDLFVFLSKFCIFTSIHRAFNSVNEFHNNLYVRLLLSNVYVFFRSIDCALKNCSHSLYFIKWKIRQGRKQIDISDFNYTV